MEMETGFKLRYAEDSCPIIKKVSIRHVLNLIFIQNLTQNMWNARCREQRFRFWPFSHPVIHKVLQDLQVGVWTRYCDYMLKCFHTITVISRHRGATADIRSSNHSKANGHVRSLPFSALKCSSVTIGIFFNCAGRFRVSCLSRVYQLNGLLHLRCWWLPMCHRAKIRNARYS